MFNFLLETFRLGLKNLRLHKLRSLLTALGIIIGVLAVIVMVAIGEGAKQAAMEQLAQLGARNIMIRSREPPASTDASATSRTLDYGLREADLTRLSAMEGVEMIVPLRDTEQKVVRGDIRASANAIGTTPDLFDVINLRLSRGQYFSRLQYEQAAPVCVIGHGAAQQLFPYDDPMGQTIRVGTLGEGGVNLVVVGVLEPTGLRADGQGSDFTSRDLDLDVYFPLTLSKAMFGFNIVKRTPGSRSFKRIELSEIWIRCREQGEVEAIAQRAEHVVGIQQKAGPLDLKSVDRADVKVKAPIEILRTAERQQRTFNAIMVSVAGFALVVGGIGIMNIMLATVTERTREIGIRRALGAKRRHITLQFLIETTVITLMGGAIGIALGCGGAEALPSIVRFFDPEQNYRTAIALWSVLGSFGVSGLIGIGFGLYPAMKAAWMNPIEALRHE
ncbi:MAG TPA: ABC transporter permease [Humisphaera sp.]